MLADVHQGGPKEVERAIDAAGEAWEDWSRMPWEERAAIFLRAAELLAGPWRSTLNASTMLGQSKTAHQAEIDAACEVIDFYRFNVEFMTRIYEEQPISSPGVWNRMEYRPLEGFVFAVSPFNFTAIGANLPASAALMGNTVVWKPAGTAAYSAHFLMGLLQEAGLPPGVINLVYGSGATIGDAALASPDLAGIHFTGSTAGLQLDVAHDRLEHRQLPQLPADRRRDGRQGLHRRASLRRRRRARDGDRPRLLRVPGQKCSAASRVYAPANLWPELRERLADQVAQIKMGDVADFENFMGAVIDAKSLKTQQDAIEEAPRAQADRGARRRRRERRGGLLRRADRDRDEGSRLPPAPDELFGPVVTAYVYPEGKWSETLELVDRTAPYGLTGAVFADDRDAVLEAKDALRYAAGNFYVNDKPTGAVVGQQPFGGGRASGTNDKAGSMWNLIRWVSPRTIKETFVPRRTTATRSWRRTRTATAAPGLRSGHLTSRGAMSLPRLRTDSRRLPPCPARPRADACLGRGPPRAIERREARLPVLSSWTDGRQAPVDPRRARMACSGRVILVAYDEVTISAVTHGGHDSPSS